METKKQVCNNNSAFAYYSGGGGITAHYIEYDTDDYLYITAGAWIGKKTYHKLKIQYTRGGVPFVVYHGYRMKLGEFIRI